MKELDLKLKILLGVLGTGVLVLAGAFALQAYLGSATLRFGSPDTWTRYTSGINNIAFRVPDGFLVLPPSNSRDVPFSIVKEGERGGSVLMQIGTLRRDEVQESTEEEILAYERRFVSSRITTERVSQEIDGRSVITLLQREASGRVIGQTFAHDPAVQDASYTGGTPKLVEVREISLQLPESASAIERRLYRDVYLAMVETLEFLAEPSDDAIAAGVPSGWSPFALADSGFSVFVPGDWEFLESRSNLGLVETVFATRDSEVNNSYTTYTFGVLPAGQSTSVKFLTEAYVQPFRDTAFAGSLSEETLVMPGIGEAVSLEARQEMKNIPDLDELTTLLVIVAAPDTPQAGRGYVLEARLPDGKAQEMRLRQIQQMTRSFSFIFGNNPE